jgi:hypothetical protein
LKERLRPLLDFIRIQSDRKGNAVETPNDDPEAWGDARELDWFASDEAELFVLS